ncbi:hypothetical protein PG997_002350 [Apiospora hydei]|uniref:Uncharacterized protein n=1 Tax=Apiospora hydei TaxID=1337664 RepID=A0ABR1X935_9PEZI
MVVIRYEHRRREREESHQGASPVLSPPPPTVLGFAAIGPEFRKKSYDRGLWEQKAWLWSQEVVPEFRVFFFRSKLLLCFFARPGTVPEGKKDWGKKEELKPPAHGSIMGQGPCAKTIHRPDHKIAFSGTNERTNCTNCSPQQQKQQSPILRAAPELAGSPTKTGTGSRLGGRAWWRPADRARLASSACCIASSKQQAGKARANHEGTNEHVGERASRQAQQPSAPVLFLGLAIKPIT